MNVKYRFVNMGGINWSWLLCLELVTDGARVVFYDRWHNFDATRPTPAWVEECFEAATGFCDLREGAGRILEAVRLDDGLLLRVVNPRYVFSYHDFDEVKAWVEGGGLA
jgi:hypothetical protein